MTAKTDIVKGRIEEAAGVLTGNDALRERGRVDQAKGKIKGAAKKAVADAKSAANTAVAKAKLAARLSIKMAKDAAKKLTAK
jgi:uncharacterized protein YjbJ (UPF0337 family)